jgi:hypothetical protein
LQPCERLRKRKAKKIGRNKPTAVEAAKQIEAKLVLCDVGLLEKEELMNDNYIWGTTTIRIAGQRQLELRFPNKPKMILCSGKNDKGEHRVVTDQQVRKLMKLNQKECLSVAAAKSGMSENTARKYLRHRRLSSQVKAERAWRTREDPFEEDWSEVQLKLEINPGLES